MPRQENLFRGIFYSFKASPEIGREPVMVLLSGVVAFFAGLQLIREVLTEHLTEVRGGLLGVADVLAEDRFVIFHLKTLDGETYATLIAVDVHHLGSEGVAYVVGSNGGLDLLFADLRDVNQTFDTLFELYEYTEVSDVGDGTVDFSTYSVTLADALPWIFLNLLDAKGETLALLVDIKNNRLYHIALLVNFRGVLDTLGPGDVGDVNETVDFVIDTDEETEIGDVLDLTFNDGSHGVLIADNFPGILRNLLHTERDTTVVGLDVEYNGLDLFAHGDNLGGVTDLSSPGHFRYVYQTFDALFELNKHTVIGEADHASAHFGANGVLLGSRCPGILSELLHTEGYTLLLEVEGEDLHGDVVAHREEL